MLRRSFAERQRHVLSTDNLLSLFTDLTDKFPKKKKIQFLKNRRFGWMREKLFPSFLNKLSKQISYGNALYEFTTQNECVL